MGTGDGSEGREGGGKGRTVGERRVSVHWRAPMSAHLPPPAHCPPLFEIFISGEGREGKGAGRTRSGDPCLVFRFFNGEYFRPPRVYPTVGAAPGF